MVAQAEWKTSYDRWLACEDGTWVRWSAIEVICAVPAVVNGTVPRKYEGYDVVVRLNRGVINVAHFATKEEAEAAIKSTMGQLSGHYE
jgi:hypothetical protein